MLFKVRLLLGAAVPFVFAMPAAAQLSISTATTAPVSTSTASNNAPADISIATTGSITLPAGTANQTAVTVNSNNTVTNAGQITITNADNSTGVRITAGRTTGYTATGAISLVEDYTQTDTDNDGDLDGPVASGTGRVGVLVDAGAPMVGTINLQANSIVAVEGNQSYGVSVRSVLDGSYRQKGTITLTGANGAALDFRDKITGDLQIGGGISVNGEHSIGVNVLGDVGGEFMIDGTISATGFTSTTISNYADPDFLTATDTPIDKRRDADDLLIGGPAVSVRGNLAHGLLINGAAVGTTDPTASVKDVVQNFNENRTQGVISTFGSAPALLVQAQNGAATDLRLARVRESVRDTLDDDKDSNFDEIIGTFDYDFGFINRGQILANGFNIGFKANAIRIAGSDDGTRKTIIDGGIFNGGSVTAIGFEADAIGYSIGSGADTPVFQNIGSIISSVNTETTNSSYGVLIDAGANLPTFINNGGINANTRGYDGDAVAFRDLSGTTTSFRNTSRVVAGYTDDDTTDTITSGAGKAIAIDLSHSAQNVIITQTDPIDNARIFGDVLLGAGNDRFDLLSGEVRGNVDFGGGNDTFNINSGGIGGKINFGGTGAQLVMDNGGIVNGDVTLNAAGGAISLSNKSFLDGAITRTSNAAPLTLSLNNSELNNRASGTLQLSSLSLQNTSKMGFVVNNARIAANTPIFNVSGVADIGAGTVFTPIFEQFSKQPFTLRVLTANTLNLGGTAQSMLNSNSPYLYNVSLTRPTGTNALDLSFRVKTANELGLSTREASAYGGVLDLLSGNDTVAAALTSIATGPAFLRAYSDILPGPDASIIKVLGSNSTAAFGATAHRLDLITDKPDAPGGAWTEEFGVYHSADADANSLGVFGGGFGVAAGLDLIAARNWVLGGYVALESVELEERGRSSAPLNVAQTTFGAYGGLKLGDLALNAAGSYGGANFTSDRDVIIGTLSDRLKADWNARTTTGGLRATYSLPLGFIKAVPYAAIDYIGVDQDAYQETAVTNSALELAVGKSKSALTSASYGVELAAEWGSPGGSFVARPQISLGYRNVMSWDAPDGMAHFVGAPTGSTPFALNPGHEPENAIVAGLGLNINGQYVNMKLGYDAEISDSQITHYGSITLRLAFW